MPIPQPILYNRALVIAKVEATPRVDQIAIDTVATLKATHAMLVENVQVEPDIQTLVRNNARPDLSPDAVRSGRRLGRISFLHEIRGTGSNVLAPRLGNFLRACGMAQTARATTSTVNFANIIQVVQQPTSSAILTGAAGVAYTGSVQRSVTLTVTTGGGSGVCAVTVNSKNRDGTDYFNAAGITVTTSTPVVLGIGGDGTPSFTPTLAGTAVAGDIWQVDLLPTGTYYDPVSGGFETVSIYCYYGASGQTGVLHKLIGAMGTWTANGKAAEYGKFNFQMTGDWATPTDATVPTGVIYNDIIPPICELADLYLANKGGASPYTPAEGLLCDSFSIDMANQVNLRSSIGDSSGYVGSFIGGRRPVGTLDPETVLEATHGFWAALEGATLKHYYNKLGVTAGNIVSFYSPNAQYAGIGYADRETLRVYNLQLAFARSNGNDELMLSFR